MSDKLVTWNTARYINDRIDKYRFLRQFKDHNKEIYDIYRYLETYDDSNYNKYQSDYSNNLKKKFITHLDNMFEFEKFLETKPSASDVGQKALDLFDNKHVNSVRSIEMLEVKRMNTIEEYCSDIHVLFNAVESLHQYGETRISLDLKLQIDEILNNKGLDHFTVQDELIINKP